MGTIKDRFSGYFSRSHFFVVPILLLAGLLAWMVVDGVRTRNKRLSEYALPVDQSAKAMLEFIRNQEERMGEASGGWMQTSNTKPICAAVEEAYSWLDQDRDSLTETEKREADYFRVYFLGHDLLSGHRITTDSDVDQLVETSKAFLQSADTFETNEFRTTQMVLSILEGTRRHEKELEFAQWLRSELESKAQKSDAARGYMKTVESIIGRLNLIDQELELSSRTIDAQAFDIEKLRGKIVLIEFWSTSCRPCLNDFPAMKRIYEKFHDQGFEVVGICLNASANTVKRIVSEYQLPWIQLYHEGSFGQSGNESLSTQFGVQALPTTILVGPDGRVIAMGVRPLSESPKGNLENVLERLLRSQKTISTD